MLSVSKLSERNDGQIPTGVNDRSVDRKVSVSGK